MKSVKPSVDGDDVDKLKEFTDKGESPTQEEETQDFDYLARLNTQYKESNTKELKKAMVSRQEKAKCSIMWLNSKLCLIKLELFFDQQICDIFFLSLSHLATFKVSIFIVKSRADLDIKIDVWREF